MNKTDFQELICRPYCMFFSEGEKEEMACLGAQIADRLIQNGRVEAAQTQAVQKNRSAWESRRQDLGRVLCAKCEFRAQDCDFQSPAPADDLEPCGGYIVLVHLLEQGMITLADIEGLR